jgi:hypothetical protein
MNNLISGGICAGVSVLYMFIVCAGLWGISSARGPFRLLISLFVLFYCVLIFFTVGNSKLRLPLMPFFMIYCSYIITCKETRQLSWNRLLSHKWAVIAAFILIGNGIYKYGEIRPSPSEVYVRKVELSTALGFPKTSLFLLKRGRYSILSEEQEERLKAAKNRATHRLEAPVK